MDKELIYIYYLNSYDNPECQYIGITKDPFTRHSAHCNSKKSTSDKLHSWIKDRKLNKDRIIMNVFYYTESIELARDLEKSIINYCLFNGFNLKNSLTPDHHGDNEHILKSIDSFNNSKLRLSMTHKYGDIFCYNSDIKLIKKPSLKRIQVILSYDDYIEFAKVAKQEGRSESNLAEVLIIDGMSKMNR